MQQGQTTAAPPSPQRIMQMCFGFAPPAILAAAIKHRVFDSLAQSPLSLEQLVEKTQTSRAGCGPFSMRCCRWSSFREPMESIRSLPKAEPFWSAAAPRITAVSCAIR